MLELANTYSRSNVLLFSGFVGVRVIHLLIILLLESILRTDFRFCGGQAGGTGRGGGVIVGYDFKTCMGFTSTILLSRYDVDSIFCFFAALTVRGVAP